MNREVLVFKARDFRALFCGRAGADPLKAWGDTLAKYDEVLKYAPNWTALKDLRDTLQKRKS